jgi:DNA-binding GntR family transcriptional regulator
MTSQDAVSRSIDEAAPVYDRLRADIIAGYYQPGSALRFAQMQKRYGLGVSRLREALAQLAADRLVLREVNRGFRVPEVSLADFDDIAALRLRLEPGAFRDLGRERRRCVGGAHPHRGPPARPRRRSRYEAADGQCASTTTGKRGTAPSTRR